MMIQQLGGKLIDLYDRIGSLPLNAEKSIIGLFRKMMMYDSEVEEVQTVQKSIEDTSADIQMQVQEKRGDAMEVGEIEDLPKLFISPAEKIIDEFNGNSKDLKGRFKIPVENKFEVNLHQQVCNTSKNQFDNTN